MQICLFKGRSNKFPSTLSFPASFYKGLEELDTDLDPKQIDKLLVFFEVMSTQEKISKVSKIMVNNQYGNEWNSTKALESLI